MNSTDRPKRPGGQDSAERSHPHPRLSLFCWQAIWSLGTACSRHALRLLTALRNVLRQRAAARPEWRRYPDLAAADPALAETGAERAGDEASELASCVVEANVALLSKRRREQARERFVRLAQRGEFQGKLQPLESARCTADPDRRERRCAEVMSQWERHLQMTERQDSPLWSLFAQLRCKAGLPNRANSRENRGAACCQWLRGWRRQLAEWGVAADARDVLIVDEQTAAQYEFNPPLRAGQKARVLFPSWSVQGMTIERGVATTLDAGVEERIDGASDEGANRLPRNGLSTE